MIYASDPDAAADFVAGELRHLVAGNTARLLDVRRTPVTLTGVRPGRGDFGVRVEAYEGAGARWVQALGDVTRFQFPKSAGTADRQRARGVLEPLDGSLDVAGAIAGPVPRPRARRLAHEFPAARDLAVLDRRLAEALVANPWAGELVRGHAIVLAELGLCLFYGEAVRDPRLFAGSGARSRRAEHLIGRLA